MSASEEAGHNDAAKAAAILGINAAAVDENILKRARRAARVATANAKAFDAALQLAEFKPAAVITMSNDIPQQ
ncbi:hypothetical protein CMQ_7271 [Grosmannia clavigera kw1407]|uniref:Uncharacterized protein n=1 Tax=Grosmannia clavigera (strain kw1407 / UAMH 11150) TaxID=655863 RepID=F0XNQ6_GROCL|nr:uncharacterized protein CMQ_7271 [Grosmannia clavigera kw1407]EFX00269.1 hypothetical protein CMQ_7271 [Grosmannia clavigera kw1407]